MESVALAKAEVEALNKKYEAYVSKLKIDWLAENRLESKDVYEVMRPEEREKVHNRIAHWSRYITPLAEAWWRKRGYGVIWPNDDSKPMQVRKLQDA